MCQLLFHQTLTKIFRRNFSNELKSSRLHLSQALEDNGGENKESLEDVGTWLLAPFCNGSSRGPFNSIWKYFTICKKL